MTTSSWCGPLPALRAADFSVFPIFPGRARCLFSPGAFVLTQVPTLGAVGLSYWVASLPASTSVPALRQLVADSASAPEPAGAEPRAPADERGAGAAARGGRTEPGRPGNGAAAEASAALGAVAGDLLAAGSSAAASPERERQLADLTASLPAGAGTSSIRAGRPAGAHVSCFRKHLLCHAISRRAVPMSRSTCWAAILWDRGGADELML